MHPHCLLLCLMYCQESVDWSANIEAVSKIQAATNIFFYSIIFFLDIFLFIIRLSVQMGPEREECDMKQKSPGCNGMLKMYTKYIHQCRINFHTEA